MEKIIKCKNCEHSILVFPSGDNKGRARNETVRPDYSCALHKHPIEIIKVAYFEEAQRNCPLGLSRYQIELAKRREEIKKSEIKKSLRRVAKPVVRNMLTVSGYDELDKHALPECTIYPNYDALKPLQRVKRFKLLNRRRFKKYVGFT